MRLPAYWRVLLLLFPAVLFGVEQEDCALRGTVSDSMSGRALARIQVFARTDASALPVRRISNAAGMFCFENLRPGDYGITTKGAGYLDASYGERRPGGAGLILRLSAGQSQKPLTVKMTPQSVITGKLLDAEGDPIERGRVQLLKRSWADRKVQASQVNQTETDEEGRFRLSQIAPGTYFVSATGRNNECCPMRRDFLDEKGHPFREQTIETYYKESLSFERATPIALKAGQEIDNLTLTLEGTEARHLSGTNAPALLGAGAHSVLIVDQSGTMRVAANELIGKDGSFRADSLAPARYLLAVGPFGNSTEIRKEVDLTQGDADGVVLEPVELLTLNAELRIEGANAISKRRVVDSLVLSSRTTNLFDTGELDAHGKCKFEGIRPDVYSVAIRPQEPYYVKRILIDGEPQAGTTLDLRNRKAKGFEVILSPRVAAVRGRVSVSGQLHTGVTILLEPENDPSESKSQVAGPNGELEWKSLTPGKYRLYAFEDFDSEAWNDPELGRILAPKAIEVQLGEGETLSVKVPLISASEFEDALRKAGL